MSMSSIIHLRCGDNKRFLFQATLGCCTGFRHKYGFSETIGHILIDVILVSFSTTLRLSFNRKVQDGFFQV
jgi:hypothetical protein